MANHPAGPLSAVVLLSSSSNKCTLSLNLTFSSLKCTVCKPSHHTFTTQPIPEQTYCGHGLYCKFDKTGCLILLCFWILFCSRQ